MRVGVLTGGGDCPGLNAALRAVVRRAMGRVDLVGLKYGWAGLLERDTAPLDRISTTGILPRGGTILGTSRTNPIKMERGVERALEAISELELDGLIPIGGEDTLGVANHLADQGVSIVGIPKTIDNDLGATDFTFGFHTAVQIATDAIDRLHTTAESHNRVMVVEVMGRHAGWIATYAGLAGGADAILIPEQPFDIGEVVDHIRHRHDSGRLFSIVVVAEGAKPTDGTEITLTEERDAFGHIRLGGIGIRIQEEIEARTGYETRTTILGHVQRGGSPTAFDRVLASRFGVRAVDAVLAGEFGTMVALRGEKITLVPLAEALELKKVDPDLYATAEVFFG